MRRVDAPLTVPPSPDDSVLSKQWSARIAGPIAPRDLLVRLIRPAQVGSFSRTVFGSEPGELARSFGRPVPEERTERRRRSLSVPLDRVVPASRPAVEPRVVPRPGGRVPSSLAVPQPEEIPAPAEPIAPPAAASSLPALVPAQKVREAAFPLAGIMAQLGSRGEAAAKEDDLDLLAAKLKRILDEQARRHGIDV
jgi:hypothetical protein